VGWRDHDYSDNYYKAHKYEYTFGIRPRFAVAETKSIYLPHVLALCPSCDRTNTQRARHTTNHIVAVLMILHSVIIRAIEYHVTILVYGQIHTLLFAARAAVGYLFAISSDRQYYDIIKCV